MLVAIGIFFYVRKIFEKSRHEIYNITIDGDQAHFNYFTG